MDEVQIILLNKMLSCDGILLNTKVKDLIAQIAITNPDTLLRLDPRIVMNILNTLPEVLENIVLRSTISWISTQKEEVNSLGTLTSDPFSSIIYSDQRVLHRTWNIILSVLESHENDISRGEISSLFRRHLFK